MSPRTYPKLPKSTAPPMQPISFIVVHFSDDYFYNILRSNCVHDATNQLITIDNRSNLFYDNLGQAINAGIDKAQHELVAVVHEDVLLVDGWQQQFETSLEQLEKTDPDWGLLGAAGWNDQGRLIGHFSDPHQYQNSFKGTSFNKVRNIDEQLMIIRASSGVRFDSYLPSIHNVGRELYSSLKARNLSTYVIDAPTIHKYADQNGAIIGSAKESPKIRDRRLPSWEADWSCSTEYLFEKWPEWRPADFAEFDPSLCRFGPEVQNGLEQPIVLLSRGGSGSRLLSCLGSDAGIFLGNELNLSKDSIEMLQSIYMGVLNKYLHRADWQRNRTVTRIRHAAASMLERSETTHSLWGFKLPECMLILPELVEAFPDARYVHLVRDPLTTCLRRTHMTARFDNTIGRVAIREAYRYCGRDLEHSLEDSPGLRMAYTTIHQVEVVKGYASSNLGGRYLEIRFEDLIKDPANSVLELSQWLGSSATGDKLQLEVDPARAAASVAQHEYPPAVELAITEVLKPLRRNLGYL